MSGLSEQHLEPSEGSVEDCCGQTCSSVAGQIRKTALSLFAHKGYTATSVNEIVESAGVTKPMLYYYFGSKEQLARHLVVEPLEELGREIQKLENPSLDPKLSEIRWLSLQLNFCRADPDRARFVFALYFGPLGAELADAVGQFGQNAKQILQSIVRRLPDAKGFDDQTVDDYVRSVHGQLLATVIEMLYNEPISRLWSIPAEDLSRDLIRRLDVGHFQSLTLDHENNLQINPPA